MAANTEKKASYDDDKAIDFKKLEKELTNAVEDEARYWRENDAKFRAVHQKVATYDEFRDIVLASHLKPLDKEDRLSEVQFVQPWNTQAKKKEETANREKTENIPSSSDFPTSGQAFLRNWRLFNKDTSKQYEYLKALGGERLESIFKPEIGFGLLGDFGHCMNCGYQNCDFHDIVNILKHLSKTNRFTLTVQFLSSKEKEDIKNLFVKMKQSDSEEQITALENLQKLYDVKL